MFSLGGVEAKRYQDDNQNSMGEEIFISDGIRMERRKINFKTF